MAITFKYDNFKYDNISFIYILKNLLSHTCEIVKSGGGYRVLLVFKHDRNAN